MTFVNAGLLIIVLLVLVNLWERLAQLTEEVQRLQRLVIEGKPRQHSVASREGPTIARVEKPKTKRKYKVPVTGRQRNAIHRVLKGGIPNGDQENDRLRSDPDEVSGSKRPSRGFRRVGGEEGWQSQRPS